MGKRGRGRIVSRPYCGGRQVVESKRRLFGKARQAVFLSELATTCNVMGSAAAAGVTQQCVYQRRRKDAGFRAEWQTALEEGYARIEAMLLERAIRTAADASAPPGPLDQELAKHLLREHQKGLAGIDRGAAPALRSAEWCEVEAYFIAKLRALKVRIDNGSAR